MGYHVPPGGKWNGDYRVLDIEACAKAESSNDVKPFRVKAAFPESPLTLLRLRFKEFWENDLTTRKDTPTHRRTC